MQLIELRGKMPPKRVQVNDGAKFIVIPVFPSEVKWYEPGEPIPDVEVGQVRYAATGEVSTDGVPIWTAVEA